MSAAASGRVLVVCALAGELADFVMPPGAELLCTGVGPVDAAIAVARRLARGDVRAVVGAGLGGAFEDRGSIGEAVAVVHETLAEFGLEGGAQLQLPDGARLAEHVEADAALVALARAAGLRVARGLTVTLVTTTDATGRRRRDRYEADVETMEGFAVLQAARSAGVPAIGVRGISNVARERARSGWNFGAGAQATASALQILLPSLFVR